MEWVEGEESLSPSEDYSHPSLIVNDAGATFPKFGTNFLSPHLPITFCQTQPNFTCYRVIPHISRWSVVAASAERDKGDRFTKQLLSEFSG